jgi:transposase
LTQAHLGLILYDMAKRQGPAHVVTTRRAYKGKVYETHLLRRTYREGGKVHNVTLANLSHIPAHLLDLVRRGLKGEQFVSATDAFKVLSTRNHGHVVAVLGTIRNLGLDVVLDRKATPERQLVLAMIAARILRPQSKLATTRSWNTTTIAEELGIEGATEDDLYGAMDWLLGRQGRVEKALAARHLKDGELTLYDVTSTYFEGHCCPIAMRGHSRDGKKDKLQVVFGLLSNADGCPVAVEVFPGNTGDPKTLPSQVNKLRKEFGLSRITIVGDRGMITSARIRDDLKGLEGVQWITALRAPQIQKMREVGTIQLELFDDQDLAEVEDPAYPGERLIVCRNPFLAQERRQKREDLLKATEERLAKIARSVTSGRLKIRAAIGLRVGKVIGRFKVGKLFSLEIKEKGFRFWRNKDRIEQEATLDGFYVIRTNVPKATLSAPNTVRAYKGLSKIERAFRNMKTTHLDVRPIFHWTENRVRSHIFLCMLAYYVQWHMEKAWKPLLFHDEELEAVNASPKSPVTPARRSLSAQWKDATKCTLAGDPVHSLRTLLADLGTIARNRVCSPRSEDAIFDLVTQPTSHQSEAFKLLDVRLTL